MTKIEISGKTYMGELIYEKNKDSTIYIYALGYSSDKKFLVLRSENEETEHFIVTGIKKAYKIIDLLEGREPTKNEAVILKDFEKLKGKCYSKRLRRCDREKLRRLIAAYYDKNYEHFVLLGMKLSDVTEKAEEAVI